MRQVGNLSFQKCSYADAEQKIIETIETPGKCKQVILANAYSVVLTHSNHEFARVCKNADYIFADGISVIWASMLLNNRIPKRIAGPDFMWSFLKVCAEKNYPVFLLGGSKETLHNLQKNMRKEYPKLYIAGAYAPPFGQWSPNENENIIRKVNISRAKVLWVGISTPKQDIWISKYRGRLKTKVAFGIGAAFDFHSGAVRRAPIWMQKVGLEWFFRFLQEPTRLWKRYLLGNINFIGIVAGQLFRLVLNKIRLAM